MGKRKGKSPQYISTLKKQGPERYVAICMKNKLYKYMPTKVKTISIRLNKKLLTMNPSGNEILIAVEQKKKRNCTLLFIFLYKYWIFYNLLPVQIN